MNFTKKSIIDLLNLDQQNIASYRKGEKTLDEYKEVSSEISENFLKYIDQFGFPYKDSSSQEEYTAGIVLSLHLELDYLIKVFNEIDLKGGESINPQDKAYFIDKIRVLKGLPQVYGTQFLKDKNGQINFLTIEDESNLNNRRNLLGLEPIEEYIKKITI